MNHYCALVFAAVPALTLSSDCGLRQPARVETITAGNSHTCALLKTGAVFCWGDRQAWQCDNRPMTFLLKPTGIDKVSTGVDAISAGTYHTCVLTKAGGVSCWNGTSLCSDASGQQNYVGAIEGLEPTMIGGLERAVVAIASGGDRTCVLTTTGAVKCFDYLKFNWLRFPETVPPPIDSCCTVYAGNSSDDVLYGPEPAVVENLDGSVSAVAIGAGHACVIMASGRPKCWGSNGFGQLGDGTTVTRLVPSDVKGLSEDIATIAIGRSHTCALTISGAVLCWGLNRGILDHGQLGDGTTIDRLEPVNVRGLDRGVKMIVAGKNHTCALKDAGDVWCWGANHGGQLGDGSRENRLVPTMVIGLDDTVETIASGELHTCALTNGGVVMCWGDNMRGQLGDGTRSDRATPTKVIEFTHR